MRRIFFLLSLFAAAWTLQNCGRIAGPDPLAVRATLWKDGLTGLEARLARFERLAKSGASESALRASFASARAQYKAMEFLWEYGFPASARRLNGPAVDEVERNYEHTVIPAEGFQVLEEVLYAGAAVDWNRAARLAGDMRKVVDQAGRASAFEPLGVLRTGLDARPKTWTDSSVLDAVRLEIHRLATLGLTGFDSPIALRSLPETRAALEGMADFLSAAFPAPLRSKPSRALDSLRAALLASSAACAADTAPERFDGFDRLAFLRSRLDPAYGALGVLQEALAVPLPGNDRAFDPSARHLFAAAWNPDFFGPDFGNSSTPAQADLGRRLFSDPLLSGDAFHPEGRGRSCATCHRPELGFGDGLRRSPSLEGHQPIARNAPSLLHAAFQQGSFWDLRAESLEDQAGDVIQNPSEMGGSLETSAGAMARDPQYATAFAAAFGGEPGSDRDEPVTSLRIRRALAAYIRSLARFDSPWDRYMRGEDVALDAQARHGFNVFMGKGKCATCHFPPLFNGTVPPLFLESELKVLGVPADPPGAQGAVAALDSDSGRMAVDGLPRSRGAFRTPTVRNAAFTAPYMHNGVFATLEEVVEFYDAGGGTGLGLTVPNQTLPTDSLKFTVAEEEALLAFMKALSDTAGTQRVDAPPSRYTSAP